MTLMLALLMVGVAGTGAGIVLTREPRRQVFAISANGVALTLLFFALQAPDVALSELAVGTAATPLLFFATLAAIRIPKSPQ